MALKSVELQNVEFKSSWRDEYLKVIYAFANADGWKGTQRGHKGVKIPQGKRVAIGQ